MTLLPIFGELPDVLKEEILNFINSNSDPFIIKFNPKINKFVTHVNKDYFTKLVNVIEYKKINQPRISMINAHVIRKKIINMIIKLPEIPDNKQGFIIDCFYRNIESNQLYKHYTILDSKYKILICKWNNLCKLREEKKKNK